MSTPLELVELTFTAHKSASRSVSAPFFAHNNPTEWATGHVTVHAQSRDDGAWDEPIVTMSGANELTHEQFEALAALVRKLFVAYRGRFA